MRNWGGNELSLDEDLLNEGRAQKGKELFEKKIWSKEDNKERLRETWGALCIHTYHERVCEPSQSRPWNLDHVDPLSKFGSFF